MKRALDNRGSLLLLLVLAVTAAVLWGMRHQDAQPPASLEQWLRREGIAGAVIAVQRNDGRVSVRTIGAGPAPGRAPLDATTTLPIASLTKPITAAVVRRLIAEGRLSLDTPALDSRVLGEHPGDERYGRISIRHLLQHTAGLDQRMGDPMFADGKLVGCDAAVAATLRRPLLHEPGRHMQYSNTGYCLLGTLIEQATGMDYPRAVRHVLGLGTSEPLSLGPSVRAHRQWPMSPAQWAAAGAAGGLFSNAGTLLSIYSSDARDRSIVAPATTAHGEWYYGLGWRVWPQVNGYRLTHYGDLPGMFSAAVAYPDGRVALALLNGRPGKPEESSLALLRWLDRELHSPGDSPSRGRRKPSPES